MSKRIKRIKKHARLAALLEEQIARGDYALVEFPRVREIAAESGVSVMTAHNAVQELIRKGVLARRAPGPDKAGTRRCFIKGGFNIGILMPPSSTGYLWAWQMEIEAAATANGATVREVICRNWNDALLGEALRGFDGVFLLQFPDEVPAHTQELITSSRTPVVSLDHDLVSLGIPSILSFPQGCCRPLLDHLYALGHRHIACMNHVAEALDIRQRIGEWRTWMAEKGLTGLLINEPKKQESFQEEARQARDYIVTLGKSGGLDATAVMCTTVWTAVGAMQGLQACGLVVGRDVSIGAINDEGMAELVFPTLTAIRLPDVTVQLKKSVRWMMRGGKWKGSLLMKSVVGKQLFIGQSSKPPTQHLPVSSLVKSRKQS